MDNGPFGRTPRQSPQRRPAQVRPEPVAAPQPAAQPVATTREEQPVARVQPVARHEVDKTNPGSKKWLITIIVAVVVLAVAAFAWMNLRSSGIAGVDKSKYQAVFLTSGQVYFGKLTAAGSEYMKLSDVYYVRTVAGEDGEAQDPQQVKNQAGMQLIKLGDDEIHAPEDEMIISRTHVLFYENLKVDSQVVKTIQDYKTKK